MSARLQGLSSQIDDLPRPQLTPAVGCTNAPTVHRSGSFPSFGDKWGRPGKSIAHLVSLAG